MRASYLSPPDFHRLDWACRPIYVAFQTPPYLVGSVLHRPDFRDIDLRLILDDEIFKAMIPNDEIGLLLNIALSGLIAHTANQPASIDFQIQQMTAANNEFGGQLRNPMGVRLQWRTQTEG